MTNDNPPRHEELHHVLLENLVSGLIVVGKDGKIAEMNEAGSRMLGIRQDEILGRDLSALGKLDLSAFLRRSLEEGLAFSQKDFEIATAGGKRKIGFSTFLLKDKAGAKIGATAIFQDITEKAMNSSRMELHLQHLKEKEKISKVIAESGNMKNVLALTARIAPTDTTVLMLGESGTGKGLIAKYLHQISNRQSNVFAEINCAAIPENLLESEIFGYEKGAFTDAKQPKKGLLEIANNGTLFLDEIADMALPMQAKILKVLEEKKFRRLGGVEDISINTRFVAATNKDLEELVGQEKFRKDLFYRINVFPIEISPLRERKEDIVPLAEYFVEELGQKITNRVRQITQAAKTRLLDCEWNGNIRELRNIIERAMILEPGGELTDKFLDCRSSRIDRGTGLDLNGESLDKRLDSLKERYIKKAMQTANNDVSKAARLLKISRRKLEYYLKKR